VGARTNTGGLATGIDRETAKERQSHRMQQLERCNGYGGSSKSSGYNHNTEYGIEMVINCVRNRQFS